MDLKETLGHGDFRKELENRGLSKDKVFRHISIAKFFLSNGESNVATLQHLKPSQVLELTKLPDEKKQQLTPEAIEEYGQLSVRNLKAVVKQEVEDFKLEQQGQDELQNTKAQLTTLQQENAQHVTALNQEQLRKAPETLYGTHPLVAHIKQVMPGASEHCVQSAMLARQLLNQLSSVSDQQAAQLGAEAVYHWLGPVYRQLGVVLTQIEQQYSDEYLNKESLMPSYDEDEWQRAEQQRQTIIAEHQIYQGALV